MHCTQSQKDGQNYKNTGFRRAILPKCPSRRADPSLDGRFGHTALEILCGLLLRPSKRRQVCKTGVGIPPYPWSILTWRKTKLKQADFFIIHLEITMHCKDVDFEAGERCQVLQRRWRHPLRLPLPHPRPWKRGSLSWRQNKPFKSITSLLSCCILASCYTHTANTLS